MRLVRPGSVGAALAVVLAACSSVSTGGGGTDGGTSGTSGTSSGVTPANPQVIVTSQLVPGDNPSGSCPESGAFLTIGSFGEPPTKPPAPVANGASFGGGNVTVACRVAQTGDLFTVEGSAELTGPSGGSIAVRGTFKAGDAPNAASLTIAREGRSYAQQSCVARFNPPLQTIAAGRVWFDVECPSAEAPALLRKCQASAEIRFENCQQQ